MRTTLLATAASWIGGVIESDLTSQKLVEYARWRMSKAGGSVQAQTVSNELSHLGAVLSVARPAWGYQIDATAMPDARKVLRKMGMILRSRERSRRPTKDELGAYPSADTTSRRVGVIQRSQRAVLLYRVVQFRDGPRLYMLSDDPTQHVHLKPTDYRASFRTVWVGTRSFSFSPD